MATSEQVARLAGVSRATVSRVLNGSAQVSEETKKRIYAAVATLGYGSNSLLRAAPLARSHLLALALFGSENGLNLTQLTETQCYFYLELLRFVEQEVAKEHYDLFLPTHPYNTLNFQDDPEISYILALQAKHVEGVITLALRADDSRIQALCRSSVPSVFIDSFFQGNNATYVKSDYSDGARQATEHLLHLGHKRIAVFPGDFLSATGMERLMGYHQAMARAGLVIDPQLIRQTGWERKEAYQEAMLLLHERRDFTAIVASSDMLAFGVLKALHKLHIRVPEEVSLIGFDDIDLSQESDPPLTTVRQDKEAISKAAIAALFQCIRGDGVSVPVIVPTHLIVRASTGPAPNK